MIPFPSHVTPGLAPWGADIEQRLRLLETPQGPVAAWSCPAANLPPAGNHPDQVVKITETGDLAVSTYDGANWQWVIQADLAPVQSVAGLTGTISAAALKTALAIAIADVTGLQTSLDAKLNKAGDTTGANATAGDIGEYGSNSTNNTPSSGALINGTSVSLPAGDYDVWASTSVTANGASFNYMACSVSQTSATFSAASTIIQGPAGAFVGNQAIGCCGILRVSTSVTSTVYAPILYTFTGGAPAIVTTIYWRRRR